jgi:biotin operon repressor
MPSSGSRAAVADVVQRLQELGVQIDEEQQRILRVWHPVCERSV